MIPFTVLHENFRMKRQSAIVALLLLPSLQGWLDLPENWLVAQRAGYSVHYTTSQKGNLPAYLTMFEQGKSAAEAFFTAPYSREFAIYAHPTRESLDSTWQRDCGMSGFKSECWMVASGIASKLDLIAPTAWEAVTCEHSFRDTTATQRVIAHEMVHVYHGQRNKSPDFSEVSGIDWFVEGMAVYASGQCDAPRIAAVQKAMAEGSVPTGLADFWTGNARYGLSGSVVMYLDHTLGRAALTAALEHNTLPGLLAALQMTEAEILSGWQAFMEGL